MANCTYNAYLIYYTELDKGSIQIQKSELNTDTLDIALIGKTRLEYGEIFNENILHILERFACPEDIGNPGNPDLLMAYGALLENPTVGQIWYNKTQRLPFVYTDNGWIQLKTLDDVAGNSGVISHGEFLPMPIGQDGYNYSPDECSWVVSPFEILEQADFIHCTVDTDARVTMQYRVQGELTIRDGLANYQIIGIRSNINYGWIQCQSAEVPTPTPLHSLTPTPTPSPTHTITPTVTPDPTVTPTPSITPTLTASPTITPTISNTPATTPDVTPTTTPTVTPTMTMTQTLTPTPTPTPTVTMTPSMTPPIECDGEFTANASGMAFPNGYNTHISVGTTAGYVFFTAAPGGVPDAFNMYVDDNLVYSTGYIGSPSYQSAMDAVFDTYGMPHQPIKQSSGVGNMDYFMFYKPASSSPTLRMEALSPLDGGSWDAVMQCPRTQPKPASLMHFNNNITDAGEVESVTWTKSAGTGYGSSSPPVPGASYMTFPGTNGERVYSDGDVFKRFYRVGTDFTAEAFVRFDGIPAGNAGINPVWSSYNPAGSGGARWSLMYDHTAEEFILFWTDGTSEPNFVPVTYPLSMGTWHHIALTKEYNTLKVFCDGNLVGTGTLQSLFATAHPFSLGFARYVDINRWLLGAISEFRLVHGMALYQDGYTVPTAPFS